MGPTHAHCYDAHTQRSLTSDAHRPASAWTGDTHTHTPQACSTASAADHRGHLTAIIASSGGGVIAARGCGI
jgi:hypothetical protein